MAGVLGFEPRDGGTKNRCLTTWLYPINDLSNLTNCFNFASLKIGFSSEKFTRQLKENPLFNNGVAGLAQLVEQLICNQ